MKVLGFVSFIFFVLCLCAESNCRKQQFVHYILENLASGSVSNWEHSNQTSPESIEQFYQSSLAISSQYPTTSLKPIPEFITSTSIDANNLAQEEQLLALNPTNCRVYCMWRYVQNTLEEPESFTVEELRQNTSWIEPYSATLNWESTDYQVNTLVSKGISPIIEIGEGTDHTLPYVSSAFNSTTGVADPGTIGEQQYIAYMYRYSRAVVHRYKSNVTIWQIENELNDAYLEAVGRIRSPSNLIPMNTPWGNFTFVTQLIQTLYMAVKDEDPSLWTTQNLLCDTPHDMYQIAGIPMYYLDALHAWEPLLDMISFDAYPNALIAYPIYYEFLSNITNSIHERLVDKNKPIMCAETGAHIMSNSSIIDVTLTPVNFTSNAQAEYLSSTLLLLKMLVEKVFKFLNYMKHLDLLLLLVDIQIKMLNFYKQ